MDVFDACPRQHTRQFEGGVDELGDGGENVHDYLHQSFNGSCQTWDVSERRKNEEQRTKIENECGGWNGNETGEQGVAGKTSEIENDEGKGAYLGCQGNAEQTPYCADDVAVG